ncbi:MAG: hypothetical protein WC924_05405 [Candidatus Gracilibacteria bacterium]
MSFLNLFIRKKESFFHHVWTIMFTAVAVILFWKGVWGLIDEFLFPENPILGNLIAIFIGLLILYLDDKKIAELENV